mgnify:CR=1 FL=1
MKFRKLTTKYGTSIILGKDKEQNEKLISEFLGKDVFILHTEAPGSPFCVIAEKPKKTDKKEAAIVCARYSQDWRDHKKNVKVHIFTGKDVYKSKLMPIGTFGVKKFKTIIVKKEDILKLKLF